VTRRLAAVSARHPWRTIAAWLVTLVLAVAAIVLLLEFTTEQEVTNNPESHQGYDLIAERIPPNPDDEVTELVIVRSEELTVDDPAFEAKVAQLASALRRPDVVVGHTVGIGVRPTVSRDRHATVLTLGLLGDGEEQAADVVEVVEAADDARFDVEVSGEWTVDRDFNKLSQDDLKTGELQFGLPVALIVLLLVFGAVVAGLVPMALALISIAVGLGIVAVVSQFADLSVFTLNMLSGMGLALGVDYALFVVSRFREERARDLAKDDAIEAAGASASRAVLFSGVAFVLAMFGLLLVPDTIFRSLATGAIVVGAVSVVAALTLLPALLSLLGDRINSLRLPVLGRSAEAGTGREGRFWSAIVRAVMRYPVVTLIASAALLLALASPVVDLRHGFVGLQTLPDRFPSKQGFTALNESFGIGTTDSVQVVVDGNEEETLPAAQRLARDLANEPKLRQVTTEQHRDLVVVEALLRGDSQDDAAYDTVERIRAEHVPNRFSGVDARVLVTGETAENLDYFEMIEHWQPIVFAFVLGLSFVLLTIVFRSIVVSLKAIVLNLLSVGAAYGLLVLVFQKGIGNELFGFEQVDAIEAWVPLFLFAVLFGLSMDYHVFLLSRIRERFVRTRDNEDAVAHSVASTARLITGAALIIIAVFSGFARGDLFMFQQMGFGVAVSLLIDATIVRSVLLPASMRLLGEWNWYLPKWLEWLPHLEVEGGSAPR
jgi:putative drug exporter of the RND superfamily